MQQCALCYFYIKGGRRCSLRAHNARGNNIPAVRAPNVSISRRDEYCEMDTNNKKKQRDDYGRRRGIGHAVAAAAAAAVYLSRYNVPGIM